MSGDSSPDHRKAPRKRGFFVEIRALLAEGIPFGLSYIGMYGC